MRFVDFTGGRHSSRRAGELIMGDIGAGIPAHIAIIMDGNGRWAKKRGLPRTLGHREGAETLKRISRYCNNIGISYLTVYAFSTENWKRPAEEVSGIVRLLRHYIGTFDSDPERDRLRIRFIGDIESLEGDIKKDFASITERTKDNMNALTLTIAYNYGGRDEIIRAVKKAAVLAVNGRLESERLSEADFSGMLDTAGLPDPDLIIRSGGESRISNFLLWQSAYSELWFTDTLWPDFNERDIDDAIVAYRGRQRRYGGARPGTGGEQ